MNYQTLKTGDVRRLGDEQRNFYRANMHQNRRGAHRHPTVSANPWRPICLVGHTVLGADLCHLEFRRPLT